ncbi:hypothetical protein [Streptomyces sp. NPDC008122]|uniref:hypothetical protein n=1 Tax=Streptomyces sp. NPDC008122 TaxID=3364810 RepID=UPI0036E83F3C
MPVSEHPAVFGRLQIYEVVAPGDHADEGNCIVRCIGGIARVGQVFVLEGERDTVGPEGGFTLERIKKLRSMEFVDPPHSALIHLSGGPLDRLREGDVLVSHPAPDWYRKLEASGLRIQDYDRSPCLPDVRRAHLAFAGYEVKPTTTVSHARPDAAAELDRQWDSLATSAQLVDEYGEFCVPAPGPGRDESQWIRVKDPVGADLPSRLLAGTGQAEFLAVSVDGRTLCAVSDEEYDKWIIVHRFDEESRGA